MEAHRIAVNVVLSSNHVGILGALSSQLLHAHGSLGKLHEGWNRLKTAMAGGLAIAGGMAALGALGKMVDKGNELVKVQQNMAAAGVKAAEVQEAVAKAWQLTGKYQNVSASEALKVISEARMTFGSQRDATHHSEDFIRMISFLKAFQGGKHGGGAADFEREAIAAMKSGEIAGKITPTAMAEHVKQLTAMRVAYGDQLKIQQYLTAQRAGGVALRNTSDSFRYGMFPALVQENGSNAGVMLMTAFNKIVAGTGNRTKSVEHMAELGLLDKKHIEYGKDGHVKGLKDPSAILNNREAAMNFGDWVQNTLRPLLDKRLDKEGLQGNDRAIRESQLISAMFPDRNAAKAITEILQQYTKLAKDAALMAEARKSLNEGTYVDKSWDGQKQVLATQWENFLEAFGAPAVGQAADMLRKLNSAMSGLAQWAANPENATTVASIFKGLAVGAAALAGAGAAALLAAIGPAGWAVGGIIALGSAFVAFKPQIEQAIEAHNRYAASWAKWILNFLPENLRPDLKPSKDGGGSGYPKADAFFEALKNDVVGKWNSFTSALNMAWSGMKVAWTGFIEWVKTWPAAFAEMSPKLKQMSIKTLEFFANLPNDIGNAIASWPSRLRATIDAMSDGIIAMLKNALSSIPLIGGLITKSSLGGGGFDGATLQNASYGGAGGDSAASAVARGAAAGGYGGGTGGGGRSGSAGGGSIGAGGDYHAVVGGRSYRAAYAAGGRERVGSWLAFYQRPVSEGGLGMSLDKARAMVAMTQGESGINLNPGSVGDFGTSIGTAQWRLGRANALKALASRMGKHWSDVGVQQQHMRNEMLGAYRGVYDRIQRAPNGEAALAEGIDNFERPKYARKAYQFRLPYLHGLRRNGTTGEGHSEPTAPPTAPPPPRVPHIIQARHDIHLDGRKVASSVSRHMAENARFPRHVGGMDTHGSYRTPGTRLTDAA